jgi:hypothetical protein
MVEITINAIGTGVGIAIGTILAELITIKLELLVIYTKTE